MKGLAAVVAAKMRSAGFVEITLKGRCMEPLFVEGDRVRAEASNTYEVGDICLIALGDNNLAVHRVIALDDAAELAVTKGDYSGKSESTPYSSIVGRVVALKLKGCEGWVEWRQDDGEKRRAAQRSAAIDFGCAADAETKQARRKAIWAANEQMRRELVHRCSPIWK